MAVKEICLLGNPILRVRCKPVVVFNTVGLTSTDSDLNDTLVDLRTRKGFGRGISAPQIGIPERVIVIDIERPFELINPVIVHQSRKTMTLWDDCFSFPDLLVKVR